MANVLEEYENIIPEDLRFLNVVLIQVHLTCF